MGAEPEGLGSVKTLILSSTFERDNLLLSTAAEIEAQRDLPWQQSAPPLNALFAQMTRSDPKLPKEISSVHFLHF